MKSLEEDRLCVSTHRSYIMGFAILWIMVHHSLFFGLYDFGYLEFFSRIGSCGVDVFLFVSAFGLFRSLSNHTSLRDYYFRRLMRILPTFLIVMILLRLFTSPIVLLSPRYWFNCFYSNWYVSFILIVYLLSPFIFKLQEKRLLLPFGISVLVSLLLTVILVKLGKDNIHDVPMLMSQRLPVFTAGMLFADSRLNLRLSVAFTPIIVAISCLLLGLCFQNGLEYLVYPLFFFLAIGVILLLSDFHIGMIDPFLKYTGTISLELYLVHMAVIPFMVRLLQKLTLPDGIGILLFILMCLVSYLISIGVNRLTKLVNPVILKLVEV